MKKSVFQRVYSKVQTFSDNKPEAKLNKNQYLTGLLMSYSKDYFMQKHKII